MPHYKTCSVGLTIYNRSNWAENIDPAFLDMRYQEQVYRFSTPQKEWRCQDSGIGFDCGNLDNVCRRCDCCGAWICYGHCKISTTYNGERARLCSRCDDMLIMPECEMLASVNGYKNERLLPPRPGSSSTHGPSSTPSVARALPPGPANPEHFAPPRRLFGRRRCKTRVSDVDFPTRTRASSNSSDDSAPSTYSSETSQPTSEDEESQGAEAGHDGGADMDDGLTEVAMQENWTIDECLSRPGLFRYLEITQHVRFGDEETSMVTSSVIKPYGRENDSLPWVTVHDAEAAERVRSALCAEITAGDRATDPPPACSATAPPEEGATSSSDNDPTTAAGGLLTGLPRLSRKSAMFGMAAVAVGLVAWGMSRRR